MSGSGVQLPKWKSYTLPSWEQVHILREPPKSIHTRKKERVDMSNVNYMIRNDDTRINEGVAYLQRGVNPHVDVMYNNVGGGGGGRTTTMPNVQASNPYKVMKDGAFRPPIFTQEDLLPLSRQRRPETVGITNPGIRSGYNIHNLVDMMDKEEVHSAVDGEKLNYIAVRPTAVYKMQLPQEVFTSNAINKDVIRTSASAGFMGEQHGGISRMSYNDPYQASKDPLLSTTTTNIALMGGDINRDETINLNNYIKDNIILENISPNFSIVLYNPSTQNYSEVFGSTRDRLNIAVQSSLNRPIDLTREDGTQIKIKDYRWQIVTSAVGRDNLVLQIQNTPDIELNRNTPLYAVGSNVSGSSKVERFHTMDPVMEDRVKTSATSSVSMRYGRNDTIHDKERNVKLRGMGSYGSSMENFGSVPTVQSHSIPTLTSRGLEVRQAASQEMGSRYASF